MALLLVLIGIIASVGFALYCMICERIAASDQRHEVSHAPPIETEAVVTVSRSTADISV